ncbi:MAG: deoxyribose-phosphate aldolase [Chitinophagaceae bacterium]
MNIARFIDHTALGATTNRSDVEKVCAQAIQYNFAAVCLPPFYVADAVNMLRGTTIKVATVIGFPLGYTYDNIKVNEARTALTQGAQELDMVINLSALKNASYNYLEQEAAGVLEVVRKEGAILKVIIESGILASEEIIRCCNLYSGLGVDYLKTSTGFAEKGASLEAVEFMRLHLPEGVKLKASGGIRSFSFAENLINAGADRLGCSASIAIVKGAEPERDGVV